VSGEYDVYGEFKPVGGPIFTKTMPGGVVNVDFYATEAECRCYTCDPTGTSEGNCVPTTNGKNGHSYSKDGCAITCKYECDGGGGMRLTDTGGYPYDNVKCWNCEGAAGPESTCVEVRQGLTGTYLTRELCDDNAEAKCGWGYGAVADKCDIIKDVTRGTSAAKCNITNEEGWKYGCFDKFAIVEETCVPIPDTFPHNGDFFRSQAECDNKIKMGDMAFMYELGEGNTGPAPTYSPALNRNGILNFTPGVYETRYNMETPSLWFDSIQEYLTLNTNARLPVVTMGMTRTPTSVKVFILLNAYKVPFAANNEVLNETSAVRTQNSFSATKFFTNQTIFSIPTGYLVLTSGAGEKIMLSFKTI